MSYSISTLLTRNLQDVFGENDPARRCAAIDELWIEDGVFYDPKTGAHRGRDEIDRVAGAIRATHPDFRYQPIAKPEELGNAGRVQWVAGRPGEPPAYAGTDSSLLATAGLPPFISFSTSYPELRNFWDATKLRDSLGNVGQITWPKPLLWRTARIFPWLG
jgi:SnoaL-like domain